MITKTVLALAMVGLLAGCTSNRGSRGGSYDSNASYTDQAGSRSGTQGSGTGPQDVINSDPADALRSGSNGRVTP